MPAPGWRRWRNERAAYPATWRRPPQIVTDKRWRIALQLGIVVYLVLAIGTVEVNWARVYEGLERGQRFVMGFLQPDFTSRWTDINQGVVGKPDDDADIDGHRRHHIRAHRHRRGAQPGAARRLLRCRSIIAVSRALQEIIIAIFLVAMFGFGPFAGFLTLSFATIGFIAKLLADDIEEIDPTQAEAIRATGASWVQLVNYAVQPQVMPRLIGLSLYRLDINFRESRRDRHRRRRRHRGDAEHRHRPLRIRQRRGDPADHHRAGDGRRVRLQLPAKVPAMTEISITATSGRTAPRASGC